MTPNGKDEENNLLDSYHSSQMHLSSSDDGKVEKEYNHKIVIGVRKQTDEPRSKNSNYLARQFTDLSSSHSSLGYRGGAEYT